MDHLDASAVKSFYDSRWAGFQYANRLKMLRAGTIVDLLAQSRAVEPRILDIGAGAGWMTNILSMFGPAVGVELSREAVATASARFPRATFVEADIRTWTAATPFDVVVAQEVLEHFEVHEQFLEAVDRLLAPGGYLIVTTPNKRTLDAMVEEQRRSFQNQPVENPLCMEELQRLIASRFRVVTARTIVPGFGVLGFKYRLAHSRKLWQVLDRVFGEGTGESLSCRLGLGLHLAILARKEPT